MDVTAGRHTGGAGGGAPHRRRSAKRRWPATSLWRRVAHAIAAGARRVAPGRRFALGRFALAGMVFAWASLLLPETASSASKYPNGMWLECPFDAITEGESANAILHWTPTFGQLANVKITITHIGSGTVIDTENHSGIDLGIGKTDIPIRVIDNERSEPHHRVRMTFDAPADRISSQDDQDRDNACEFDIYDDEPPEVVQWGISSRPLRGDTYGVGETIKAYLRLSRHAQYDSSVGTGSRRITLLLNDSGAPERGAARSADFVRADDNRIFRYEYTVAATDLDENGVTLLAPTLVLDDPVTGRVDTITIGSGILLNQVGHKVDGRIDNRIPDAPTGLTVSGTPDHFDLSWEAPAYSGTSAITGYRIDYLGHRNGQDVWKPVVRNTGSTGTTYRYAHNLSAGNQVTFSVSAINNSGNGLRSDRAQGTVPPSVTDVSISSRPKYGDTYYRGEKIDVRVKFDRRLDVDTTETIQLSMGAAQALRSAPVVVLDNSVGNIGVLTFRYVVQPADLDTDGITVRNSDDAGTVGLVGGFITDAVTDVTAFRSYTGLTDQAGHKVDGRVHDPLPGPPTDLTASATTSQFQLNWEAPAYLGMDDVSFGGAGVVSGYRIEKSSDSGKTWSDLVANTGSAATEFTLSHQMAGGEILHFRVSAINSASAGKPSNVDSATVPPSVTSLSIVSSPLTNNTYTRHELIEIEVKFDTAVNVRASGNVYPEVDFVIGETARSAQYSEGSGTSRLLFLYSVRQADRDTDGISIADSVHDGSSGLRYGVIQSPTAEVANRAYSGLPDNPRHKVNGRTVNSVAGPPTNLTVNATRTEFSLSWEAPEWLGVDDTSEGGSGVVSGYRIESSSNGINWAWRVANTESAETTFSESHNLAAGTRRYYRVSAINRAGTGPRSNEASALVPTWVTGVAITSTPLSGRDTYYRDETIEVQVTFNRNVVVAKKTIYGNERLPALLLVVEGGEGLRGQARFAEYVAGSGTKVLTFRYTVQSNDYDANGVTVQRTYPYTDSTGLVYGYIRDKQTGVDAIRVNNGIENASGHKVDGRTADPEWALTLSSDSVTEGDSNGVTATVSITNAFRFVGAQTVNLTWGGEGPIASGIQSSGKPTAVTIAAGASSGSVTLVPKQESAYRPPDTRPLAAIFKGSEVDRMDLTRLDAQTAPVATLSTANSEVTEGDSIQVTVGLTGSRISVETDVTLETADPDAGLDGEFFSPVYFLPGGISERPVVAFTEDDRVISPDRTLTVSATENPDAPAAYALGESSSVTVTIKDDDEPAWRVTAAPSEIAEAAGGATLTVSTGGIPFAEDQTIVLDLSGGTATAGEDFRLSDSGGTYLSAPYELTLPAGATSVTATLGAANDMVVENDETIVIVARHDGAQIGETQTVTIADDDEATWTVSTVPSAIAEAGGVATLVVSLGSAFFGEDQTISLDLTGSTATAGSDFTLADSDGNALAAPYNLTLPAGSTDVLVTVAATDDDLDEDDEQATIAVSHGDAQIGAAQTVTIADDDEAGILTDPSSLTLEEGGAAATYTVALATKPTADVTVNVSVPAGADLSVSKTSLTFTDQNWNAPQTVTVSPVDDDDGLDETVTLGHAASGGGYAGQSADVEVTIADDDLPTLSIADARADENASDVTFTVTLGMASSRTVTVAWSTADGTATAGADYTAVANGSVTFNPGDGLSKSVTVALNDDAIVEGDETFTATLSAPTNATLRGGGTTLSATGTIADNDAPTWSVVADPFTIAEAGGASTLTVSTGNVTFTEDRTIALDPTQGSATVGEDFTISAGGTELSPPYRLTLPAGDTSVAATITGRDDPIADPDERIGIVATHNDAEIGEAYLIVTDDDPREVTVSPSALTVAEGESGAYTLVLTSQPTADVTVTATVGGNEFVEVAAGVSPADSDFGSTATLTFTASDWSTAQTVTVRATPDRDLDDASAQVTHAVAGGDYGANRVTAETVAVTVPDDGVGVTFELAVPVAPVQEGAGTAPVSVTAVTDGAVAPKRGYLVRLVSFLSAVPQESRSSFTAQPGADFKTVSEELEFKASGFSAVQVNGEQRYSQTVVFKVQIHDDALAEGEETFPVSLQRDSIYSDITSLGTNASTGVRILDDDALTVALSADAETVSEGGDATFTVTVAGGTSTAPVEVGYTVGGTATAGDDYTAPSGSLTIGVGQTSGTITIPTVADDVLDPGETLTVTLGGAATTKGTSTADTETTAETTIEDTGTVTVSVAAGDAATEGSPATFTVSLSGAVAAPVTVNWSTSDGSAKAGSDYTAVTAGTVTFPANSTDAQTLTVATLDDSVAEDEELFRLALTAPTSGLPPGVSLGAAAATGRIADDDPREVTVSPSALTVAEGESGAYTVVLTSKPTADVTVTATIGGNEFVEIAAGVSPADSDFGKTATLTFAPSDWSTAQKVTVRATPDLDRDDGSVQVTHAVAGGDYEANAVTADSVAVTVTDDGVGVTFELALPVAPVQEGAGTVSVSVTAVTDGAVAPIADYPVNLVSFRSVAPEESKTGVAAQPGTDFRTVNEELVFKASGFSAVQVNGEQRYSQTLVFEVQIHDDALNEGEETFPVSLQLDRDRLAITGLGTNWSTGVRILDDDALTASVAADAETVVEGGDATFTVTVAGGTSTAPVEVTYTVGGAATAGADYTAPSGTLTLNAGASSGTIAIPTLTDSVLDGGETLTVTLTGASTAKGAVTADTSAVETTIQDTGTVTVSVAAGDAVTEGSPATFTVSLSGAVSVPVSLNWSTAAGTATAGDDYTTASGTVTFPAGSTDAQTLTVATLGDSLAEDEETFTVTLTAPQAGLPPGVSLGAAAATGRIADDDPREVTVSPSALTVAEGESGAYTVVLTSQPTADVTVTATIGGNEFVEIAAGVSPADSDFGKTATLTFAPSDWSTVQEVTVRATPDLDRVDASAQVTHAVAGGDYEANAVTADPVAVTVTDDGVGVTFDLAVPVAPVQEGAGTAPVSVTAVTDGAVAPKRGYLVRLVSFLSAVPQESRSGFTARPGADFKTVNEELVFKASGFSAVQVNGEQRYSQTLVFEVQIHDDALTEGEETFPVSLQRDSTLLDITGLGTNWSTGVRILDDDALTVSVVADAETMSEGGDATFTVTVAGGTSTAPVEVSYTVGGTATAGDDYTAPSGSLTIGAGQTSGTITIPTLTDSVLDGGETVIVTLTAASTAKGAATADTGAAETKIADTGTVTVSVAAGDAVTEGSSATFTVSLSGAVSVPVTVNWATSDGTAASGDDYTAVTAGTVTFPADSTDAQTLTVTTLGDALAEDEETFTVTLTAPQSGLPSGVSLGAATATGRIADDNALTVTITRDAETVAEGSDATFTVALSGGTGAEPVEVSYEVGGTATAGDDYTAPSGSLTIGAGQTSGTITIPTLTDPVLDGGETVVVTLTGASTAKGAVTADTATAAETTIQDTGTVTVSVTAGDAVTEGSSATFTVSLSGAVSVPVTVNWATSDGTATAGEDYNTASGTVSFPANSTVAQSITVTTLGDPVAEDEETFTATLTAPQSGLPSGVSLGTATATGRIADDDALTVSVVADAETVSEGGDAAFTVTVAGGTSTAPVEVSYTVGGTATAGDDYTAPSGSLTIGAGQTSGTITIPTLTDSVLDGGETVIVTLTAASTAKGAATSDTGAAETTIADAGTVTVSVAAGDAATEGSSATFTVLLSGAVSVPVTVNWATSDGTAASGDDYTAVTAGTVTFPADSTDAQTLTVTTLGDALAEDEETFTVTLTAPQSGLPSGVSLGAATATGRIADDNALTVTITRDAETVAEGSDATFTVALSGGTGAEPVEVSYEVGGTATAGDDYTAPSGSLTIGAGQTSGTITIPTLTDPVLDGGETVVVTLTGASTAKGAVTADTATAAETTIQDTGTVTVSVTAGDAVTEGSSATFTVSLSGAVSVPVTVNWATSDGTATAGEDYNTASGTVSFPANSTVAQSITVTTLGDPVAEDEETFTATLTAPQSGLPSGVSLGTATATGRIADDDVAPTTILLSVSQSSIAENASPTAVRVTATLDGSTTLPQATDVEISVGADGTATSGTDFAAVSPVTLTIPARASSGTTTFTLSPTDDAVAEGDETLTVSGTSVGLDVTGSELTITDDDKRGVEVTPTSLTVNEGESETYSVVLTSQPTADVTVTVTVPADTDVSVDNSSLTFPVASWNAAQTVTVSVADDNDAVVDDAVTLTHSVSGGDYEANAVTASDVKVTLAETDSPTLSIADRSAAEDAGSMTFTVHLSVASSDSVTVQYATADGTGAAAATAGDDYTTASGTLTFNPGEPLTQTISMTIADDEVDEPDESFTVTLSNAQNATVAGGQSTLAATGTILDDDARGVTVTPEALTVNEGASGTYKVVLTSKPTADVTVAVNVPADTDVSVDETSLTFTPDNWDTEQIVTVSVGRDIDAVVDEAVTITHTASGGDYVGESISAVKVTIAETDLQVKTLTLTFAAPTHDDRDSSGDVTLGDVLSYTATATNSGNVPLSGVKVSDLLVSVEGVKCASVGLGETCELSGAYTVVQADVDAGKVINTATAVADGVNEPEKSQTTPVAQERALTLTKGTTAEKFSSVGDQIAYSYKVTNSGTVALAGSVSIADDKIPTSAISCPSVPANGLGPESSLTCTGSYTVVQADVDVSKVTNKATATLDGATSDEATVTVTRPNAQADLPEIAVGYSSASEAEGTITISVTLSKASEQTVRVSYETSDGTAQDGTDYTSTNGTLTFEPSSREKRFSVAINDDDLDEEDETFTVTLSDAENGTLKTASANMTIRDDDERRVTISTQTLPVNEGESGNYTVVLMSQPTADVTIGVAATANSDSDVSVNKTALTFTEENWNTPQTVTVTAAPDVDAEDDAATIEHTVSGGDYGDESVTAASVTVEVADDDTASTALVLSLNPAGVSEGGGTQTVTVTAALDNAARTVATAVTVRVGGGTSTASSPGDYASVGDFTLTIPAGSTSATKDFTLTPVDDAIAEGSETVVVGVSADGLSGDTADLTLADDDTASTALVLSLNPAGVSEGGGTQTVTVTAALDNAARTGDTEVTVSVGGGTSTATSPGDYAAVDDFTLTIPAGSTRATKDFTLTPVDDGVAEGAETVVVGVSADGLSGDTADLTLADDDTASTVLSVSLSPGSVSEDGGAQTVTVAASLDAGARTGDTEVTVSVGGGTSTATSPGDYAAVDDFTLTIPAGSTSATKDFTLTPVDDAIAEGAETVVVGVSADGLSGDTADLTLADDDTASTVLSVSLSPGSVSEDGGAQTVTVAASLDAGARTGNTEVTVSVGGGTSTATSPGDYAAVDDFTLTIPAGSTSATKDFTLTPVDDAIAEGSETVVVGVSADGLSGDTADLTLADDDTASTVLSVSLSPGSVSEDGGAQTVTVAASLDNAARTGDTAVTVSVGGGTSTATSPGDYAAVGDFTLTIPAGSTSATKDFTLTPVDDAIAEGSETVVVGVSADGLSGDTAALTLTDDDTASTALSVSLSPGSVSEDGGAQTVTVTAALDNAARTVATAVTVRVGGGTSTASSPGDYASVGDFTLTIPAGSTSATKDFTLTPVDDAIAEGSETVVVGVSADGLSGDTADLTLTDDETVTVQIHKDVNQPKARTNYPVGEGGSVIVTVDLSTTPGREMEVPLTWTQPAGEDGAEAPDFGVAAYTEIEFNGTGSCAAAAGTTVSSLTFAADEQRKYLCVVAVDDTAAEATEVVEIGLGSLPQGVTAGTPLIARIEIHDNDSTLSVANAEATEGDDETLDFLVTLAPVATRSVSVRYATADGTATAGADYTATRGRLYFAPGETSKTIAVPITDDTEDDNGETFTLTLSDASGAQLGGAVATGTIRNSEESGLSAVFPRSPYASARHTGRGDRPQVVVTFSEPVAAFDKMAPSVEVTGGTVYHAARWRTEATLANAWMFWLDPAGGNAMTFRLVPDIACDAGGICTADGGRLVGVPQTRTLPGPTTATPVTASLTVDGAATPDSFGVRVAFSQAMTELGAADLTAGHVGGGPAAVSGLAEAQSGRVWTARVASAVGRMWVHVGAVATKAGGESRPAALVVDVDAEGNATAVPGPAAIAAAVTAPADGAWDADDLIEVTLRFSESVTVDTSGGVPSVGIVVDGTARTAAYRGGTSTRLRFGWKVPEGSSAREAALTPDSLRLNGAEIAGDGRAADLSHPGARRALAPPEPEDDALTASFSEAPDAHDGENAFTLGLAFSEEVELSYLTLEGGALEVTGGTVEGASRVEQGSNRRWTIRVAPDGDDAVTVTLPATTDCAASEAVCTVVGKALAQAATATVPGPTPAIPLVDPDALTAAFEGVPREHDGESVFTFLVRFSENPAVSFRTLRDEAFVVTGGTVRQAHRVNGRNDLRKIHIEPSGVGDVTVTLAGGRACGTTGAICTALGKVLSNTPTATIEGPAALSVADARAHENADATIDFIVSLDRAAYGTVTVDYATADGSATAGEDYTAASGTLSFAAGETEKTVAVALLDDAKDEGEETFALNLSNASGAYIADGSATGTIVNSDPLQQAWLARFGRTVAGQVVDAIGARLEGGGGESHVTVGGQRIALDGAEADGDALREAEAEARLEALADFFRGEDGEGDANPAGARGMTGRELALGSAFHLSAGGGEDGGPAFAAWGRFAAGGFDAEVDGVALSGEVTTGVLGADVSGERWLGGVAFSRSDGEGPFTLTGEGASTRSTGTVESTLTALYPYGRLALNERVDVWGVAGHGSGELTVAEDGGAPISADIAMTMGALGVRGEVLRESQGAPLDLTLKSDALWVRMTSETVANLVGVTADVTRLRLVLDGSRSFEVGDAGTLTPSLEVGVRHDAGDAETGTGLELGAGVRYQAEGVSVEGAVRTLVAHEDGGYEEWGASLGVRIDPDASGRGLSLSVAPAWGNASSQAERLWGMRDARGLAPGDAAFEPGRRLDAELGYGFSVLDDRAVATPYAGMSRSETSETLRLGQRLKMGPSEWSLESAFGDEGRILSAGYGYRFGDALDLTLEASRRAPANDDAPAHAVMLRGALRW